MPQVPNINTNELLTTISYLQPYMGISATHLLEMFISVNSFRQLVLSRSLEGEELISCCAVANPMIYENAYKHCSLLQHLR